MHIIAQVTALYCLSHITKEKSLSYVQRFRALCDGSQGQDGLESRPTGIACGCSCLVDSCYGPHCSRRCSHRCSCPYGHSTYDGPIDAYAYCTVEHPRVWRWRNGFHAAHVTRMAIHAGTIDTRIWLADIALMVDFARKINIFLELLWTS